MNFFVLKLFQKDFEHCQNIGLKFPFFLLQENFPLMHEKQIDFPQLIHFICPPSLVGLIKNVCAVTFRLKFSRYSTIPQGCLGTRKYIIIRFLCDSFFISERKDKSIKSEHFLAGPNVAGLSQY